MPHPLEDVWRREAPYVLAALQRYGASLEDSEDAAQEALLAAATQWGDGSGIPDNPRGWLIRVGSRRLIDAQRSDAGRSLREERVETMRRASSSESSHPSGPPGVSDRDDSLHMLLLCAHPSLTPASAVALTLRVVAGLTTRDIAAGLLVPESTAAQRISRAKRTLRDTGARFGSLSREEMPSRLHAVRSVLHLIFTTGSTMPSGATLIDRSLTAEAIRLTERLHRALPDDSETAGLLALMLLGEARAAGRVRAGRLVPLADQDRGTWDRATIDQAVALVEHALPSGPVGPFQLQAAIAAIHATAPSFAETDWPQIVILYRMLLDLGSNPAVELSALIAQAEVDGAEVVLPALEKLLATRPRDHRVLAAQAHLLERLSRPEAALVFERAAALTDSIPEQKYLSDKAIGLTTGSSQGPNEPTPR